MSLKFRVVQDGFGELLVPFDALYGAQTQRALHNFTISGLRMPPEFIQAMALIKVAVAEANGMLGHIPAKRAKAIAKSANAIACGEHADQFPVDVFQTGSGTSTNMNLNEVIAALAHRQAGLAIHPNDDVNYGQSSNDVAPSSSLLASALLLNRVLLPALKQLRASISRKARQGRGLVKTGRTHLMDAMPITVEQELSAWLAQLDSAVSLLQDTGK